MGNQNGNSTIAYNNFKLMPKIPYMIFEKLIMNTSDSAENMWKAIKYATTDAVSKPNLTFKQKKTMLWTPDAVNSSQENLFNVFLKALVPSSLNTAGEQIQLRIYKLLTKPYSNTEAIIAYQFDIITQEATCMILDEDGIMVERVDYIEACLLDILNGSDINIGSSKFSFAPIDPMTSNTINSSFSIDNSKSLFGTSMRLALRYVNAKTGGLCGG